MNDAKIVLEQKLGLEAIKYIICLELEYLQGTKDQTYSFSIKILKKDNPIGTIELGLAAIKYIVCLELELEYLQDPKVQTNSFSIKGLKKNKPIGTIIVLVKQKAKLHSLIIEAFDPRIETECFGILMNCKDSRATLQSSSFFHDQMS